MERRARRRRRATAAPRSRPRRCGCPIRRRTWRCCQRARRPPPSAAPPAATPKPVAVAPPATPQPPSAAASLVIPGDRFHLAGQGGLLAKFSEPNSKGVDICGQGGRPRGCRGGRPGALHRDRHSRFRQADRHPPRERLQQRVCAQPRDPGEGRPERCRAGSASPSSATPTPTGRSCISRFARRASPWIPLRYLPGDRPS
jgi:hypothetical protein